MLAAEPRPLDRRLLLVLAVGVLLAALVVGGLAVVDRLRGGATSPTVLADRVVTALDHEDLAALARLVEPDERSALLRVATAWSERLAGLDLPASVGGGRTTPSDALDGLDLSLSGADPQVESRSGDVAVVGLGNASVRVRTDPGRAHGLLRTWFAERRQTRPQDKTYPVAGVPGLAGGGRLVTVERAGRWYLSVLATLLGPGIPQGGTADVSVLTASPSPTPQAAVEATVRTVLDPRTGPDVSGVAATLDASGSDLVQLWASEIHIVGFNRPVAPITALRTSLGVADADRAVVHVDTLRVGDGSGFAVDGPCLTRNGRRSCLRPSAYRYAEGFGSLGRLELLGRDGSFALTAVHGPDGWRTSLPESAADALIGYADGLTRAQLLGLLGQERLDAPGGALPPDQPQDATFTSGGYALRTVHIASGGLFRVVPSPAGTNRASIYDPDGQPSIQPFYPNDSVYRLDPGDHTLLVWADDDFARSLERTGAPYVQRLEVRSVR